ncbi:DUF3421 domain-containing protein [Legionella israelensis]|uniref:DUF3421 domain-containing protein n=1 Tax=Legionella israelensis TaxID=454 RepID=A0AAX1EGE2_9GAMM|nr:DM9 repeat-containing protein [Legionella israelensis]QBR84136.1 DUF3421 domain-containing protein [Legionella israelensis]
MRSFNKIIGIFTLVGLLVGILLDLLWRYDVTAVFSYSLIMIASLLFGLAYNDQNSLRLIICSFFSALILCLPLIPINMSNTILFNEQVVTFLCAFPLFVYVGHSFHYAFHHDNSIRQIQYSSLFAAVWNTLPLLLVASIFLCLGNLLILLTAFIFKTVNSTFLWNLYFHNFHFTIIRYTTLFFIGLGIGQQSVKTVYSLRYLLLRMMYYLLPFLALISVIYFILYWIHFIAGGKEYINPLTILSPLVILGIIFFNGYFQDGEARSEYPKKVIISLKVYRIILFFLTVMLVYHVIKQISVPVNVGVYLLVLVFYGLTYSLTTVFSEEKERQLIRRYNIFIALFFLIALFILNNPLKPINYTIGKKNVSGATRFQSSVFPPSTNILAPGAKEIVYLKKRLQRNDSLLNDVGVYWQDKKTSDSFLVQNDDKARVICRAIYNKGYQIGVYENGQCIVTYGGKVMTMKDFQILAAKPNVLQWSDKKSGLDLGIEFKPELMRSPYSSATPLSNLARTLAACRVNLNGQIYVGKLFNNNCLIAYHKKEKAYRDFQSLNLVPELQSRYQLKKIDNDLRSRGLIWKSINGNNNAFIAGYFGNDPVYICRALYKEGYHVGQCLNDQCVITYAGKAIVVDQFQILTANNPDKLQWLDESMMFAYNNKALSTGFEPIRPNKENSEIRDLYSCRTIYNNRIHIGKMISGQCNIAFEGNEITLRSAQVLSYK